MGFKNLLLRYQRRIVATDDRVYFTLGLFAPISVIDATSGALIRTYAGTENTDEFVYADGRLLALVEKGAWDNEG